MAGRSSAVSFYPTEHPALNITVRARLSVLVREKEQDVGSGLASDWADYKYRCGQVDGLKIAMAMCDDVFKEMSEH